MKRLYGTHRGIGVATLAVVAAICIAACGGSSNAASTTKSTAASTTGKSSYTALRACLSKHGVTLPSRTAHGGGGFFGGGPRTNTTGGPPTGARGAGGFAGGFAAGASSKFAKAFKACGGKFGGFAGGGLRGGYHGPYGGAGAGHFRPVFTKATLAAFVACVRKHGYPAMPEANTTTSNGDYFPLSIEKNAKFRTASAKCASILRSAAGAVNPGGPNQPATTTTSSATSS
jgi:hypothetical protein